MNIPMQTFMIQNSNLKIDFHPSDKNFLIIRNCSFEAGSKLCAKYSASGHGVGKENNDFAIGNFGRYNNSK